MVLIYLHLHAQQEQRADLISFWAFAPVTLCLPAYISSRVRPPTSRWTSSKPPSTSSFTTSRLVRATPRCEDDWARHGVNGRGGEGVRGGEREALEGLGHVFRCGVFWLLLSPAPRVAMRYLVLR